MKYKDTLGHKTLDKYITMEEKIDYIYEYVKEIKEEFEVSDRTQQGHDKK